MTDAAPFPSARRRGDLVVEADADVTVLTLDRPARRNALDPALRRALAAALEEVAGDGGTRAVIVTGAGGAFCSGSDLSALATSDSTTVLRTEYAPIIRAIRSMPKPVIAAVDGVAAGAGVGLALACDLVVAAPTARFDMAFVRIGLMPDVGLAWHLARRLGRWHAARLLWSGGSIGSAEAAELGLVTDLADEGGALESARRIAHELARGPGRAIAASKQVLDVAVTDDLWASMDREAVLQGELRRTADHAEGLAAIRERRPPRFTGE